jgi:hypothetical protein
MSDGCVRETQVQTQLVLISKRLEDLTSVITDLEKRIDSILIPNIPTIGLDKNLNQESFIPHAKILKGYGDQIDSLVGRIRSLITRVEL